MTSRALCVFSSILFAFTSLPMNPTQAFENHFDATGQLDRLALGSGWLDLNASVRIPENGWKKTHTIDAKKVTRLESGGKKFWQARVGDGERVDVEITQTVSSTKDGVRIDFIASAFSDCDIEGVLYWIDLPSELFANGSFETAGKDGAAGDLPAELSERKILNSGSLESVRVFNADKSIQFNVVFDQPVNAAIQDGRQWGRKFSLLIHAHDGFLTKGQTAKFGLVLNAIGEPDRTAANFSINAAGTGHMILGLGGNFCFQIDAPEKNVALNELKPQFARTEISLGDWMPIQGAPPAPANGKVPHEFDLMRQLASKKIPYIASVWKAPAWMTRTAAQIDGRTETVIPPERLADAADAIAAYLLYAKTNFQSEPDFVSFNEPDYGAQIKFTAEEHRDAIKLLGAACAKAGLKTKCLLGDVSNPRVPLDYLKPAMDDADAMKNIGALSFHSWGGGTAQEYAAWSGLAKTLKLPLIVAEAGVDAGAWKSGAFHSFDYAVQEMAHYQKLFQHAQPQAVLYWEYTADYSLLAPDPKNPKARVETERFALQKHWLRFIPPGSEALESSGGNAAVALTAFRKKDVDATHYTFNLSNTLWTRKTRVSGIPAEVKSLNVIQTSSGILFKQLAPVIPVQGVIELELPEQSLTTLTTLLATDGK